MFVCVCLWYHAGNIMMIIQIILIQSFSPIIFILEEFNFKLHSNNDTSHTGSGLADSWSLDFAILLCNSIIDWLNFKLDNVSPIGIEIYGILKCVFCLMFFYNHFLPMRGWGIICLLLDFCWKHLLQGSNLKDKDRVHDEHDGPLLRKENFWFTLCFFFFFQCGAGGSFACC